MSEMPVQDNVQEIIGRYEALRTGFRRCINEVMEPIEQRLTDKPGTAFVDFYEDINFSNVLVNEQASQKIQEARRILDQLDLLIKKAADQGETLDSILSLREELKRADLLRGMAWNMEPADIKRVTDAAQAAMAENNEDGMIRAVFQQATARRNAVSKQMEYANTSVQQQLDNLKKLSAEINGLEDAPIQDIQEIIAVFNEVLDLTSNFEKFDVKEMVDVRSAGGESYREIIPYAKQKENIRQVILSVISEYENKARQFIDNHPRLAENWFEPLKLFKEFLDAGEDQIILNGIDRLNKDITDNCALWEQAEKKLQEARAIVKNGREREAFWNACEIVRAAKEIFPGHADIDQRAAECIEQIAGSVRVEMGRQRRDWEREWPELEKQLVLTLDWQEQWLQTQELPEWLQKAELVLNELRVLIESLPEHIEQSLGKDCAEKQKDQVSEQMKGLDEALQVLKARWNEYASKRAQIRSFIFTIQGLIRLGQQQGSESPYQDAQSRYENFFKEHDYWESDEELSHAFQLLTGYLSAAEKLKQACAAYQAKRWNACYTALSTGNTKKEIALDSGIDASYLAARLASGQAQILPAPEIEAFGQVLRQLAYVSEAGDEIEKKYALNLFDELNPYFNQIEKYGAGSSPIIQDIRNRIAYEQRVSEYRDREIYGINNLLHNRPINIFASSILTQYNQLEKAPSSSSEWLQETDGLLHSLAELASYTETLWTGRAALIKEKMVALFARYLNPYMASLYEAAETTPAATVRQVFGFLQTARQNGIFTQLNPVTRRWVIYQHYINQESQESEPEQVVANWRKAVEDFPNDDEIIGKFRGRCWELWLKELDIALWRSAQGEEVAVCLEQLFNLDEGNFPNLFAPVNSSSGEQVKPLLDRYNAEIKVRRDSLLAMQQADKDLKKDPRNLPLILRDLRSFNNKNKEKGKKIGRPEIDEKIKTISTRFVDAELELGSRLMIDGQKMDAMEHYLRALSMHPWDDAEEWKRENKSNVISYWENKLKVEIDQFKETTGSIYLRYTSAQKLSSRLNELRDCRLKYLDEYQNQIEECDKEVSKKIKILEYGINILSYFIPGAELWKNATDPHQKEIQISDAQDQLEKYLGFLKSRFSMTNEQVSLLNDHCVPMFEYLNILKRTFNTLKRNLTDTEEYDIFMRDCATILECVSRLHQLEAQYFKGWEEWICGEKLALSPRFYLDKASVYKDWIFTHEQLTLPFYCCLDPSDNGCASTQPFDNWVADQKLYVHVKSQLSEDKKPVVHCTFDEPGLRLYLSERKDFLDQRRVEIKNQSLLLGNFLILAFIDKAAWSEISEKFHSSNDLTIAVDQWIKTEVTKMNELRLRGYLARLEKWADELQSQVLDQPIPVVESSQNARMEIIQAVRQEGSLIGEGEVRRRITSAKNQIGVISNQENALLARFYQDTNIINSQTGQRNTVEDSVLENITELKRFYQETEITDKQQQMLVGLGISLDGINLKYVSEYQPRYGFFKYVEDVINPLPASTSAVDGQQ